MNNALNAIRNWVSVHWTAWTNGYDLVRAPQWWASAQYERTGNKTGVFYAKNRAGALAIVVITAPETAWLLIPHYD